MRTPDFQFICEWMLEETGILFSDSDRAFVESRLYDVAAERGMFTVDELLDEYRGNKSPKLEREIMDALVNDETHFFRNFVAFKHLRHVAIPKILETRGESDEPLRLWCAGASSGQEPYSISIMYHEAMPALKKIGLEIWATDISQTLINRAIEGRYTTQEVSRHVPDKIVRNHFRRKKGAWQIDPLHQETVKFMRLNLLGDWEELPKFDIILMRNILIYFSPQAQQKIVEKLHDHLLPHGRVMLGTGESFECKDDFFALVSEPDAALYLLMN